MTTIGLFLTLLFWCPGSVHCNEASLKALTQKAEIIVVAQVEEVEPPPLDGLQPWTSVVASTQNVRYKVIKVLKGQMTEDKITVKHYLQYKSYTADTTPRLSPALFKKGNVQIILLNIDTNPLQGGKDKRQTYMSIDESECSVLPSDPTVEKKIRLIISRR